jgi:uncharacterized protein involved in type VI secretion and phage assembly
VTAISRTRTTDKRFYGVVQGTVTDVNDSDGKQGRVKVRFDWFDDQMETEWCRVQQFYAGNGYGAFFIPEVHDEVLVAFAHGDMRMPIILGGLYNGVDKPATYRSASQDQKLIRTKGQHELLFDDTSGKQRVRIKTNGGHTADLSDTDKKVTVQSSGGQSVVIDDSASTINVQTNGGTITLKTGSGTVTIDGSGHISLTGVDISLTGTSVSLGASSVALGGSAAAHPLVLGDVLLTWLNTHIHLPTAPLTPAVPLPPTALSLVSRTA